MAKPTLVFSGFDPSVLKLSVPLKVRGALRRTRRVLDEQARPSCCARPSIFVRLPEKFHSVLKPKNGQRLSTLNDAERFPGVPPVNVAFGSRLSGFACGKNCGQPG